MRSQFLTHYFRWSAFGSADSGVVFQPSPWLTRRRSLSVAARPSTVLVSMICRTIASSLARSAARTRTPVPPAQSIVNLVSMTLASSRPIGGGGTPWRVRPCPPQRPYQAQTTIQSSPPLECDTWPTDYAVTLGLSKFRLLMWSTRHECPHLPWIVPHQGGRHLLQADAVEGPYSFQVVVPNRPTSLSPLSKGRIRGPFMTLPYLQKKSDDAGVAFRPGSPGSRGGGSFMSPPGLALAWSQ